MTPEDAHDPCAIVDPHGRPARQATDTACPRCRSLKRRLSGGYGPDVHDTCANCGYDFPGERTADE